jgi:uncharacterized protein (TIGR04141 family)
VAAKKKKVKHLNIFLIKPEYAESEQVIEADSCDEAIAVPIAGSEGGRLFIKKTPARPPKWTALFQDVADVKKLKVPSVAAAFFLRVKDRSFALAFGPGGRFLLKDDVFEDRFGLLCALNSVDPKTFRCVDVQSLNAIDSHTRIQSGQETTPDQFGLNVEQDILKAIVGAPINKALGNRMTGCDSLSVSVKLDLADLPDLLDQYRAQFAKELDPEDHQWVNNISVVKSEGVINALEAALDAKLLAKQFDNMWLSIPEIIDWTMAVGFLYMPGRKDIYPDVNWLGFLETLKGTPVTLELLRECKVSCADADHNPLFKAWSVFKCLYAEIDLEGSKFILNDGKWFKVATDFVTRTDEEFAAIPYSDLNLPEFKGKGEGAYNAAVAAAEPGKYALLDDKKKIMHGGGYGQVEVCDLLSIDRQLIHVKMYGKSSVLSHLIAQGFVSGQLIQIDGEFRRKVRDQLAEPYRELIPIDKKPAQDEFTIVYAVISAAGGKGLHLPFFSRVNMNNTRKILRGYGYKVELLKIAVNADYAKTSKAPPKKMKAEG